MPCCGQKREGLTAVTALGNRRLLDTQGITHRTSDARDTCQRTRGQFRAIDRPHNPSHPQLQWDPL